MSSSASKCFLFAASSAMFAACETGKGTAQLYHVTLGIVPNGGVYGGWVPLVLRNPSLVGSGWGEERVVKGRRERGENFIKNKNIVLQPVVPKKIDEPEVNLHLIFTK